MRQKIVAGNWKMHGQHDQVAQLIHELTSLLGTQVNSQTIIMPPSVYLSQASQLIQGHPLVLGAQNIYPADFGAYTGEISAPMVRDFNCRYVLIGHSERRRLFGENEKFVAQKFHHVKEHDMIPILCVGETLEQREKEQTEQIIASQLLSVCEENKKAFQNCIIAYEPVWAIGTGKTASPEQAQAVHQFIRQWVANINSTDAEHVPLLYGGSVNEGNARALFAMPDIDGGLVGGASLNAKQFVEIVKCIN